MFVIENTENIGIIDAGLGGLAVFNLLAERYPARKFTYLCDIANMPYNIHNEEWIAERANKLIHYLGSSCETIIIACNTVSVVRNKLITGTHELIDIITPVKDYMQNLNLSDFLLILGTKTVIGSGVYQLVGTASLGIPCIYLASAIEKYGSNHKKIKELCAGYLIPHLPYIKYDKITCMLACTHYGYIEHIIRDIILNNSGVKEIRFIHTAKILADSVNIVQSNYKKGKNLLFLNSKFPVKRLGEFTDINRVELRMINI